MTAKEIHDNLLSLFIRGIGVWLLYAAMDNVYAVESQFRNLFSADAPKSDWWCFYYLFVRLVAAAYFVLGAPPYLKWATGGKTSKG